MSGSSNQGGTPNTTPPPLSLLNFNSLVQTMAAYAQGAASVTLNFAVGSVLRAIFQASAAIGLWLQSLLVQVLAATRLSTSIGTQVDSFVNDFGLSRQQAVAATGTVTFSRYTSTLTATIPPGATVQTSDGSVSFAVIADTTQSAWSEAQNAYVIPAGVPSANVTVQAQTAGIVGNVLANTITVITQAVPGVDYVTNPSAFTNGVAAQSDAALKAAFVQYINTRALGTVAAAQYAVEALGENVTATIDENVSVSGAYQPGNFVVTVDNGTGSPPSALIASAQAAVEGVRAAGITFAVQPPTVITANVSVMLTLQSGAGSSAIQTSVSATISDYINALPVGAALPYMRLAQLIFDASPYILNVTALTLNGSTSDLGGGISQVVRAGSMTINTQFGAA